MPLDRLKRTALYMLLILASASAVYGWFFRPAQTVTKTEYVNVPQEKVVTKIKTVTVAGPERIVTIDKPIVVEKLKLPAWVAQDQNKQVIANADIEPHKGHVSAVAILDTQTGEAQILAKELPQKFLGFENTREIGMRYGFSSETASGREAQIYGRWTFARVGNVKIAGYVEANTRPDGKALLDVRYEW